MGTILHEEGFNLAWVETRLAHIDKNTTHGMDKGLVVKYLRFFVIKAPIKSEGIKKVTIRNKY